MTDRLTEALKLSVPLGKDTYVDVGVRGTDSAVQVMTVDIPELGNAQCLSCSMICLAPFGEEDDYLIDQGPRKDHPEHDQLSVTLSYQGNAENRSWTAGYFRSEYSLLIDGGVERVPAGSYLITVENHSMRLLSLRISIKVIDRVPATPISAGERLRGRNGAEFSYFRFRNRDPTKLVTIRAIPVNDERGPIGDPDLYVSNRFGGMLPVTKDTFVWKSTNVGADRYGSITCHWILPSSCCLTYVCCVLCTCLGIVCFLTWDASIE